MNQKAVIPVEQIESIILLIRGQKVILDHDLAKLYGIPTKALKQAVRRNIKRFPSDFMFTLVQQEVAFLRSQIVTSKPGRGGIRYLPMAFTEQGVAMLSSVLNSDRAIQVNVEIMRTFVRLRQMLSAHKDLERKLVALEKKYDEQFKIVFDAIYALMAPLEKPKRKIGFEVKEKKASYTRKTKKTK
ncbi:MAG: DNA-binding protein [Deltaproteobacteria bacterium CG12_big_fil_rev_8_21_14_0_65_43_10]|nr:MAG: DNA-binding protein [Deltaproteobacteria bacterium CG2_30_43_15]PIQ44594.1 MAG: DNA-binding protein [Deltaproteobacteria bacterium CG12_big_fil_rev_8_21_14_0_65_43_10]PIU84990.1 MAG: DNA-binding protein [Deltaproteobacteria bacterium CG06_land_8_20_14_3_00_44_19]PIX22475.1 MAG: DNA-binding protein [Deltaproteobacteria bacterium CG_4_8_14_3_um_filter_43_13]PIZ18562.1 MAG: DNA-binding protein [Deltaproteobacteria bacterium CG_4_10_14_0_8_um_filter_43_12]PJB46240.1 MAG: DNA-binding protei